MTSIARLPGVRLPRPRLAGVVLAAVAIAAGSYAAGPLVVRRSSPAVTPPAAVVPSAGAEDVLGPPGGVAPDLDPSVVRLDRAISAWTANLRDDPEDFVSATNLALDEYSRGRLTGNVDDYVRAQEAAGEALAAYPGDVQARSFHALLLYTTHDFAGALAESEAIYAADPRQLQALATAGDSELELGRYAEAEASYAILEAKAPGAATTARLAHLAALRGRPSSAADLASKAVIQARDEGSTGAALSWYDVLRGALAFQAGDIATADAAYRAALSDWPSSYLAMAGLARALAAEGRFPEAAQFDQRAVAIVPQPETLAALGDLYALTGRADLAKRQYDTVQAIGQLASIQRQLYNRQLVLFDVNHSVRLAEALRLATAELSVRRDVYGWDAYAWALLANGRAAEADAAMQQARSFGTLDPLLDYHQGMIAAALGQKARARTLLNAALGVNPGFDPLQAARARQTLAGLR